MKYASPPVDPPADNRIECPTCNGAGEYIEYNLGELVHDGECPACEGEGLVKWGPDDDPSAPDYWKDAL